MGKFISILILFLISFGEQAFPQTKSDLEAQRVKALEEIEYVDNILKSTSKEKEQGLNDLRVLGAKVVARESVISGMNNEIGLLESRIETNTIALEMMEADLISLREDYKKAVLFSYKAVKTNPNIVYILSAKDFNQGYKRIKYLQQISKFRRKEAEIIIDLKSEIEKVRDLLEKDLSEVSVLKANEVRHAQLLRNEQHNQQQLINSLGTKETQLRRELQQKQDLAKRIEKEIEDLIAAENARNKGDALTPEQVLVGDNFLENRGRLPWPVEKGVVTSKFGRHQHPVFKTLIEENIGIEITSNGKTVARSVFKGEVSTITAITGSNMTVIIRHGQYLSVYNNIVNVKVKKGDMVDTKQEIGEVFVDPNNGNTSVLKFMIFEKEYLDPELWIAK